MQVDLVMFKADGQRREFRLRKPVTVIGRSTECDFQIPLAMVSRRHCQITVKEDHIAVRDMGSSNGTYVNDQRVQTGDLEAGDKLVVGPVTFFVVVDGEPANLEAVRTTATPGGGDGALELEDGTVDVEAQQEQRRAPSVKKNNQRKGTRVPPKTTPAPAQQIEALEEVEEIQEVQEVPETRGLGAAEVESVEEVEEIQEASAEPVAESKEPAEDVQEVAEVEEVEEEPLPQDPLAALEAMTRPKNRPS